MMLTRKRLPLITLCSLLLLSAMAYAQVTTADLVGTIRDTSGGIVPGVTVASMVLAACVAVAGSCVHPVDPATVDGQLAPTWR